MKCLIDAGWALTASDDLCRCQVRPQHRPKLVGDIGFVAFQGLTMARVTLLDQPLGLVQGRRRFTLRSNPDLFTGKIFAMDLASLCFRLLTNVL